MKSNLVFFLGLFAALGISWAGIVVGSNAQLGALAPYYDDTQGTAFPRMDARRGRAGPARLSGPRLRRLPYPAGPPAGFGSDQERGWGDRQSVARDYIYQPRPQLGLSRIGPDLANLGDRKPSAPDEDDLLHLLYAGAEGMPSYRFLFETRQVGSEAQHSDQALKLTGALEPARGWEIVPTARARPWSATW